MITIVQALVLSTLWNFFRLQHLVTFFLLLGKVSVKRDRAALLRACPAGRGFQFAPSGRMCILFSILGTPEFLEGLGFPSREMSSRAASGMSHSMWHTPQEARPVRVRGTDYTGLRTPFSSCWPQALSRAPLTEKGLDPSPVKQIKNESVMKYRSTGTFTSDTHGGQTPLIESGRLLLGAVKLK